MSQLRGCVHKIHTVGNHHGGCGMTKCVRVNVREVIFLAEFVDSPHTLFRKHPNSAIQPPLINDANLFRQYSKSVTSRRLVIA